MTHQYRAMLGPIFEGGHDLSVGQWQKIALATIPGIGSSPAILLSSSAHIWPVSESPLGPLRPDMCTEVRSECAF